MTAGRIDQDVIDRSVTLVESTSPNALLTASLDAARRSPPPRGTSCSTRPSQRWPERASAVREIPGLDVLDERLAGRTSVAAWDPLRLSVDVRGTGATGHRIAQLMRERDDIILELFSENVVVAVFGIGEAPTASADRLVEGLRHAVEQIGPRGRGGARGAFAEPPPWGPLELAPRDAFLGPQEVVPFDAGRGADRRRIARRLSARRSQRAARGAADRSDHRLHRGLARPRRPGPRSERPNPADDPRGEGMNARVGLGRRLRVRASDRRIALPARELPLAADERDQPRDARRRASVRPGLAASQHAEMVSAYEDAGVRCHFLEPDPALPYQVFARDSSAMGPNGTFITQLSQWWRRGEYAPAIRFYQETGIPIRGMVTAGSLEGGDVMIVEPGSVLIGSGETRTQETAARQLAGWFEEDGWEARVQPIPGALRPHRRPGGGPRREARGSLR